MMTETLSLPDAWLVDELPRLYRERPDPVHPFLRRPLSESKALSWSLIIQAYQERRINLGKAAELLGLHELGLRERFLELSIPLRVGRRTRPKPGPRLRLCAPRDARDPAARWRIPVSGTLGLLFVTACGLENPLSE